MPAVTLKKLQTTVFVVGDECFQKARRGTGFGQQPAKQLATAARHGHHGPWLPTLPRAPTRVQVRHQGCDETGIHHPGRGRAEG